MGKYTIGVDFGTLSGRAVLVSLEQGDVIASEVLNYESGVIEEVIPQTTVRLGIDYALQDPKDYLEVLSVTIPKVLEKSGVDKADVIGLAIDFTACTLVPVDANNTPLSFLDSWREHPHAWTKLWKHHAAQKYADQLNALAHETHESWIHRYGGKISSEWLFPKVMQVCVEAPEIYEATDNFIEAADWVISQLTGNVIRNTCTLGYKAIYHHQEGFPSPAFFKQLDPRLEHVVNDKIKGEIKAVGEKAGTLLPEWATRLGLLPSTAVAVANVDAHVSAPAVNTVKPGQMLMIMGTSTCDILLGDQEKSVPGICGVVYDGVIPGYFGYESGQSAVGDIFGWFTENYIDSNITHAAASKGLTVHAYLEEEASKLRVGESGLLSLDWNGGNRSILVDVDVSGIIFGLTLATKPHELYRALIESTAFGKRIIIDNYEAHGVPVDEVYVCGGLPNKNKLLLQIYADVLNREIKMADSEHTPALGSAMFAAVAAHDMGGYASIFEAAAKMAKVKEETIKPIPENVERYEALYQEFKQLHDQFGYGDTVLKRLKRMRG